MPAQPVRRTTAPVSSAATHRVRLPHDPATRAPTPGTAPDALQMMKDRQAHQTAELDALNAVLPSFEALYDSLSAEQKATLLPLVGPHHGPGDHKAGEHGPRGDDRGGDRGGRGDRHDDRGRDDRN